MRNTKKYAIYAILIILCFLFLVSGCSQIKNKEKNETTETFNEPLEKSEIIRHVLYSEMLEKDMKVNIYLPKGYSTNNQYSVLYMLHGTNNSQEIITTNFFDKTADSLIAQDKANPIIIVCPQIDNSFGINSAEVTSTIGFLNYGKYKEYLLKEVIPYIDSNYSTINTREGRYIGGISMGGYAALYLAFTNTDMFCKVGGHMPAVNTLKISVATDVNNLLFPNEAIRKKRDPMYLAQVNDLSNLKIYLDCGKDDHIEINNGCKELYDILSEKGIDIHYHSNEGGHNEDYINGNVEKYLLFYAGKH